jgi:hypothetical protein
MPPSMYATQDSRTHGPGRRDEILQQSNWRSRLPTPPETPNDSSPLEPAMSDHDVQDSERVITPDAEAVCRINTELAASIPPHIQTIAREVEERQARIVQSNGLGALTIFRPSFTALQSFGLLPKLDDIRTTMASSQDGNSRKYLGDPNTAKNRSADIPDDMNCALWVMGLPPNVTHTTILAAIRHVGKVYSTVINPPTGRHFCAAAKIVFFERCQAEKLFDLIYFGHFFVMGRQVLEVRWNKVKSSAYPHWHQSRAIRITGPAHLMDFQFFEVFFKARFTYDLDHTAVVPCSTPGMASHVWYFGSLRCQAASARLAIERELRGIFEVHWADDPCA